MTFITKPERTDQTLSEIFHLFYDIEPITFEVINTSHGEMDFRETMLVQTVSGRYVIKLADNDFTFPAKIEMWKRTVEEYRRLGFYCPAIFRDRNGNFPTVHYQGHTCVAYGEEYALYRSADTFGERELLGSKFEEDMWIMTAKIAAKHLDYTQYPSAYCLFDTFCPSDETDEVLENALEWRAYVRTLPEQFQEQTERIWQIWTDNRNVLEPIYRQLPVSVFQADLNRSNVLLDKMGKFVGVYDFNCCGRDVFLNYLFRETLHCEYHEELKRILQRLKLVSRYYPFSEKEKRAALMLYRCIKPLWYNKIQKLRKLQEDWAAVGAYLNETERYLTETIDFWP